MEGVLQHKWEVYCSTNGRCIVGIPFLQSLEAWKAQRYKWGAYCRTNWRCTAVLSSRPVGVGGSEALLSFGTSRRFADPQFPVLLLLGFFSHQGKPQNYQGFSVPAEHSKSLEKTEKNAKITKEIARCKLIKQIKTN